MAQPQDAWLEQVLVQLQRAERLYAVGELSWYIRMDARAEDAMAALRQALVQERFDQGLEIAVLMARYWWVRGCRSEGRAWLSAFLQRAEGAEPALVQKAQQWLLELAGEDEPE